MLDEPYHPSVERLGHLDHRETVFVDDDSTEHRAHVVNHEDLDKDVADVAVYTDAGLLRFGVTAATRGADRKWRRPQSDRKLEADAVRAQIAELHAKLAALESATTETKAEG